MIRLAMLAVVGAVVALGPSGAAAHPADQLLQHLQLDLAPDHIDLDFTIGGGVLAKEGLIAELDTDRNGTASIAEIDRWTRVFVSKLALTIDQQPITLDPDAAQVTVPDLEAFHSGLTPIEISLRVPAVSDRGAQHLLSLRNDYRALRTAHTFDVRTEGAMGIVSQGWPSEDSRVVYGLGIGKPALGEAKLPPGWAASAIGAHAAELFARQRSVSFFLVLLGTFAFVGAVHAAQPGHGKTLVAGYLVATQGTMHDAFALASIVTVTHTAGVFAIGGITIAASAIFLPSRVVPVMQLVSAVMVVVLGLNLLRRSLRRSPVHGNSHHDHAHGDDDHHHHDHHHLSEEEHARLHLDEALALRARTSPRDLLTLGIAGGIVPCPEALAILLLAVGLHQAWLGMLAIVAFSLGLASVLVAFGAVVALLQARSNRLLSVTSEKRGSFGRLLAAGARYLPAVSALLITTAGVAMLLSETALR